MLDLDNLEIKFDITDILSEYTEHLYLNKFVRIDNNVNIPEKIYKGRVYRVRDNQLSIKWFDMDGYVMSTTVNAEQVVILE